jgi:acetyl-CoA carboxylase carboxyl transferase subunit beta
MPEDNVQKCKGCNRPLDMPAFEANMRICPKCGSHEQVPVRERIKMTVDEGSFKELWGHLVSKDLIGFADSKPYADRITETINKTGENDAIVTGDALIHGTKIAIGFMNFGFIGGSMGVVVGEKIMRLAEHALKEKVPMIIFSQSGGARMQESVFALMQLARLSGAIYRFQEHGGLYISVICNPCTGGASASFAFQGDIIISEPGALIGFAGPRVIEQTIKQKLPPGFQTAEFLQEKGFLDKVVDRKKMRWMLGKILSLYRGIPMEVA